MSITSALYTGVSGLLSNGDAMNVIGNNISNVNTTGFKESRALFADLLSQNTGNNSQIGKGVQLQSVQNIFTQGSTQNSENVTDLAIQGNSFFALKPATAAAPLTDQSSAFLSRAGAFHIDNNLTLVNPDGYQVLDTAGNPIKFSDNSAGIASASAAFNTGGKIGTAISAINTDIASAQTAVNAMPAGAAKTAAQALVDAATQASTAADTANTAFQASATSNNAKSAYNAVNAAYQALQAAANAVATSYAGSTTAAAGVANDYASVSAEIGKAFGKITNIDRNGLITYLGADGITQSYYKSSGAVGVPATPGNAGTVQAIAVVTASDPAALTKIGGSLYQANPKAGVRSAAFSMAANQPNGTSDQILSNSLEQSNVDMASEFVKMIVTQRAYSANSKTITTTDQMTQEVLGLIR